MGRGRAKAKQTKVARELKYGTVNTDLNRLQAELAGSHPEPAAPKAKVVDDEDDPSDLYSKYLDDDED
ncbi:MAG: DUF3073 domain-containing protein [Actinobacteria bacterium]|jgi:hypothetical protein|nr:DUF3073 domain-containing protein [Actinomycetota bacterium]